MTDDSSLPFDLPSVQRKKVSAAFDGGLISSDGGLVLLREAERCLGLAETLAGCIRDRRNQAQVVHALPAMLRFRMLAIACGYEDADDCDALRADPLFKLASGKAPESGGALCSQPTMSRLENTPSRIEVARMTAALVDLFCRSFPAPPAAITLDIDDTCDAVHGHQQLSLFHAHYDTRCFLPVHVYHVESGKPVAVLLRPGKTPSGSEVRTLVKHLVRRIRRHWPRTPDRLPGRQPLRPHASHGLVRGERRRLHLRPRGQSRAARSRIRGGRRSQGPPRRGRRRQDAGLRHLRLRRPLLGPRTPGRRPARGEHARLRCPLYRHPRSKAIPAVSYEDVYCARGQAENLIKLHKGQLASDRTSCQSPIANQLRLVLHTAAYWLMLTLRDAIPRAAPLARAEFATLRLRLLKIGAPRHSRRPPASASTSPRPAPTPLSSACWQAVSPQQVPERRGAEPRSPRPVQPSTR